MVSGLFSAKTVVHLSTARATSSFEHAVAVCIETPALNTSTMALIPRRVCIISLHLFGDITNISSLHFFRPAVPRNTMRADVACRAVPATTLPPHAEQRDELARACSCVDGPRLARENVACRTEVACSHVSGLFTQPGWTAGPDGVREPRPHHSSGIDVPMS